ncbi:MAG: hypothetical protein OEM39_09980 [Acidimicrobiia bacterium]|nr:hypothetical protein [Acidimicrobiia bacterium]
MYRFPPTALVLALVVAASCGGESTPSTSPTATTSTTTTSIATTTTVLAGVSAPVLVGDMSYQLTEAVRISGPYDLCDVGFEPFGSGVELLVAGEISGDPSAVTERPFTEVKVQVDGGEESEAHFGCIDSSSDPNQLLYAFRVPTARSDIYMLVFPDGTEVDLSSIVTDQ